VRGAASLKGLHVGHLNWIKRWPAAPGRFLAQTLAEGRASTPDASTSCSWGYHKGFGIVHVDYATRARTPKLSAQWCREHRATPGAAAPSE
jgi:hypothetical protein